MLEELGAYARTFKFENVMTECDNIYDTLFGMRSITLTLIEYYNKWRENVT